MTKQKILSKFIIILLLGNIALLFKADMGHSFIAPFNEPTFNIAISQEPSLFVNADNSYLQTVVDHTPFLLEGYDDWGLFLVDNDITGNLAIILDSELSKLLDIANINTVSYVDNKLSVLFNDPVSITLENKTFDNILSIDVEIEEYLIPDTEDTVSAIKITAKNSINDKEVDTIFEYTIFEDAVLLEEIEGEEGITKFIKYAGVKEYYNSNGEKVEGKTDNETENSQADNADTNNDSVTIRGLAATSQDADASVNDLDNLITSQASKSGNSLLEGKNAGLPLGSNSEGDSELTLTSASNNDESNNFDDPLTANTASSVPPADKPINTSDAEGKSIAPSPSSKKITTTSKTNANNTTDEELGENKEGAFPLEEKSLNTAIALEEPEKGKTKVKYTDGVINIIGSVEEKSLNTSSENTDKKLIIGKMSKFELKDKSLESKSLETIAETIAYNINIKLKEVGVDIEIQSKNLVKLLEKAENEAIIPISIEDNGHKIVFKIEVRGQEGYAVRLNINGKEEVFYIGRNGKILDTINK